MPLLGDGSAGSTIYRKFSTRATTGTPTTLLGTPVVSIYKDASTTPSVVGVTLTVDFNSKTGLNHVTITTASDATFYANGSHFELVVTTGTVGGVSVAGEVVGQFDLAAAVTIPTAAQIAAAVCDEINTGATHNLTNSLGKQVRTISGSTAAIYGPATAPSQAGMTSLQIKLDAGASAVNDIYRYNIISINSGTGAGDSAVILAYNGTTKVAAVDEAWAVQPDNTSVFEITPGAKALVIDKTGFSLSSTGADLIPVTDPGGLATTFPQMVVQMWRLWFKASSKDQTAHTIKTFADNGTTVRTTQSYTDDGAGNQTRGSAT